MANKSNKGTKSKSKPKKGSATKKGNTRKTSTPKRSPVQKKSIHTRLQSRVNDSGVSFAPYIYLVLKQVHPDLGFTTEAVHVIRGLLNYVAVQLINDMSSLLLLGKKHTVTVKEVRAAAKLFLEGSLGEGAIDRAEKAMTTFEKNADSEGRPGARAGLLFSISRCRRLIYTHAATPSGRSGASVRVGAKAPIYLAAILEYITGEILDLAGNVTRDSQKHRVRSRHILLAIRNEVGLNALFPPQKVAIGGGVPPTSGESSKKSKKTKRTKKSKSKKGKSKRKSRSKKRS